MKNNLLKKLQVLSVIAMASLTVGCSSMDAHARGGYGKPFSGKRCPLRVSHASWMVQPCLTLYILFLLLICLCHWLLMLYSCLLI